MYSARTPFRLLYKVSSEHVLCLIDKTKSEAIEMLAISLPAIDEGLFFEFLVFLRHPVLPRVDAVRELEHHVRISWRSLGLHLPPA